MCTLLVEVGPDYPLSVRACCAKIRPNLGDADRAWPCADPRTWPAAMVAQKGRAQLGDSDETLLQRWEARGAAERLDGTGQTLRRGELSRRGGSACAFQVGGRACGGNAKGWLGREPPSCGLGRYGGALEGPQLAADGFAEDRASEETHPCRNWHGPDAFQAWRVDSVRGLASRTRSLIARRGRRGGRTLRPCAQSLSSHSSIA